MACRGAPGGWLAEAAAAAAAAHDLDGDRVIDDLDACFRAEAFVEVRGCGEVHCQDGQMYRARSEGCRRDDSLKPCLALRTITDAVAAWHLDVVEDHHDATGGRAWLLPNVVPGRAGCRAPRREAERVTRVAEVPRREP